MHLIWSILTIYAIFLMTGFLDNYIIRGFPNKVKSIPLSMNGFSEHNKKHYYCIVFISPIHIQLRFSMGQMVGVPFKDKKKLKKLTHKWGKSHHPGERSKKEQTSPNLENASEINGLFECLLQNLDDSSFKNLKETATMLKEIILHMQKIFEEMRESNVMSQGENEKEQGEAGSRNLLQETENETDSRNHEPDHNPRGDCKENPSTVLDEDEASEDPHVREIHPPIVINKSRTNTYSGDVIFVGHNNTFRVNEADPSREFEKEDVGKLIERLRKELLFSKMSNRKLKRENGILRRWSANNMDMGMGSVYHNQSDHFSSPRTKSLPPSIRNRYQCTRYVQWENAGQC